MSCSIYDYYEEGVLLAEKTSTGGNNYSYVCKLCKKLGRKKNGEFIKIKDGEFIDNLSHKFNQLILFQQKQVI